MSTVSAIHCNVPGCAAVFECFASPLGIKRQDAAQEGWLLLAVQTSWTVLESDLCPVHAAPVRRALADLVGAEAQ